MPAKEWKTWLFPGAFLLALSAGLINSSLFPRIAPSLSFYYVAVFAAGLFLSWRFNSSRIVFSLLVLLLAHRAVEFFARGEIRTGPGRTAVLLMALLVPLNFVVLDRIRERGLVFAGIAPRFALLFVESVLVAVWCRPEISPRVAHPLPAALPLWAMLGFVAAIALFAVRFFQSYKPIEPGFVWSVIAVWLWLEFGPLGRRADAYVATAALILTAALIETSYMLAYHDELTALRGRRAFNDALLSLNQQYAIAIVDIDHFKKVNDTYGHDVGDQVLCLVAARLAEVEGGGQSFRCGGEEFAIIFRNKSAKDAFDDLDVLRLQIAGSVFRLRGTERRGTPRSGGADRRRPPIRKRPGVAPLQPSTGELSVTVSIGVAEPSTRYRTPEQVINAADQALYRAKHSGRNRVELASPATLRIEKSRRSGVARR